MICFDIQKIDIDATTRAIGLSNVFYILFRSATYLTLASADRETGHFLPGVPY